MKTDVFLKIKIKNPIAAFDLKVVDADDSLSFFVIVYSNGNSELTMTFDLFTSFIGLYMGKCNNDEFLE